jgi:excisionase family DNA binding protein
MSTTATPSRLLTPAQAAERLGLSVSTLAKYRCLKSDGPAFVRLGSAVRYAEADLADFIARQPRHKSTRDDG